MSPMHFHIREVIFVIYNKVTIVTDIFGVVNSYLGEFVKSGRQY